MKAEESREEEILRLKEEHRQEILRLTQVMEEGEEARTWELREKLAEALQKIDALSQKPYWLCMLPGYKELMASRRQRQS